jgi:hypothetical protein
MHIRIQVRDIRFFPNLNLKRPTFLENSLNFALKLERLPLALGSERSNLLLSLLAVREAPRVVFVFPQTSHFFSSKHLV